MYAALYLTPGGFSSVGFIGDFLGGRLRLADPVFGWQEVHATDCFAVAHTETGCVLPGVVPTLSTSLTSDWLTDSPRLVANKVVRGPWLTPASGGDKFVSGYPHAWERIQRWAFEVAPDWRSLALSAVFARCSIQRSIQEAESLYRIFGPTLRDALLRNTVPSRAQMGRYRGLKGTRSGQGGQLDDARSFADILEWAPWCADLLKHTEDMTRQPRDVVAREWLPWGLGVAKLSFTMMLAGRDGACLDTRMLEYFFRGDSAGRSAFESAVSRRSKAKGAKGITSSAIQTYASLEDRMENTPYFDPDWPQPYAKAQWMLWETLGRTAGTADHGALWEVIDPLIEEITGRPLSPNTDDPRRARQRASQAIREEYNRVVDPAWDAFRAGTISHADYKRIEVPAQAEYQRKMRELGRGR